MKPSVLFLLVCISTLSLRGDESKNELKLSNPTKFAGVKYPEGPGQQQALPLTPSEVKAAATNVPDDYMVHSCLGKNEHDQCSTSYCGKNCASFWAGPPGSCEYSDAGRTTLRCVASSEM